MGSKKPDRAMELLRAHLISKFVIPPSDLSPDEIFSRQGRAEADILTAQECDFKNGLLQGVIPPTQWTSAHLALFTAAELRDIGDTRYRDSPNRYTDCIYITEMSRGEFDYLFPDEAALLRHRSKIEATVQQAWQSLMPDNPDPAKTVFKKMQRTMVNISPSQKISTIRYFLNAPQEQIDIFHRRLDAYPFAGRLVLPGKTFSVNLFHRARPSLVRVIAHPGDDDVDPEHLAFLLRFKLFAARAEADLHAMSESRFSTKLVFELAAYALPRCLAESPFLQPPGRSQIPLTFPDGPPACTTCHTQGHAAARCPRRPPPPALRPCPTCAQVGHFGLKCPSLQQVRLCHYCESPDHIVLNCPAMSCRYCYQTGHRARGCKEAAISRAAKALRSSRPASSRAAAAAPRVHPPSPKPAAPARQSRAPVMAPPGRPRVPLTDSVVSAAGAATAVHAAPLLETERSHSASVAHAAAADRTTQDSMDALACVVSGDPPSPKKRARESGTADTTQTSKPQSDDMAVEDGVITLDHVPPDGGSMDSSAVDPPDGGINLDDSVSDILQVNLNYFTTSIRL